jgi:hypothetical protein
MRELRREIEIDARPDRVWAVVTDFAAYPEWNPFIRRISGEPREGARLEVRIEPPGARATTFKPTVRTVEANRELRWLGRLLIPGILNAEHSLRIEPLEGGRSRFIQSERFSGVLAGLVKRTLAKTEAGFEQMNAALKARVEQGPPRTTARSRERRARLALFGSVATPEHGLAHVESVSGPRPGASI